MKCNPTTSGKLININRKPRKCIVEGDTDTNKQG